MTTNVGRSNKTLLESIANKVTVNPNKLGSLIENRIGGNVDGSLIITENAIRRVSET